MVRDGLRLRRRVDLNRFGVRDGRNMQCGLRERVGILIRFGRKSCRQRLVRKLSVRVIIYICTIYKRRSGRRRVGSHARVRETRMEIQKGFMGSD